MSTTGKGDTLEDELYSYLCDQQDRGGLVFDAYPSHLCNIYKKRKYYCGERKADVEFDVVIELFRHGRSKPHLYVVFECKNHETAIAERDITDFSDKIGRIFRHAAKGIIVVSSCLQSGAESVANHRKMGIVKFDKYGLSIIADRKSSYIIESDYVRFQMFKAERYAKSLKFSAYYNGGFYASIDRLIAGLDGNQSLDREQGNPGSVLAVPFVSDETIQGAADSLLTEIGYQSGPVDLASICSILSLDLVLSDQVLTDVDGNHILGSANFDFRTIQLNFHENKQRERFTVGHEIGHFCLGHGQYLSSEAIIEQDLFLDVDSNIKFNLDRLECQANIFASDLLLPRQIFLQNVLAIRNRLGIVDKGHGFIFVDNQPCNFMPYNQLRLELSSFFDVSMLAIEIKLKKMGLVTDQRKRLKGPPSAPVWGLPSSC